MTQKSLFQKQAFQTEEDLRVKKPRSLDDHVRKEILDRLNKDAETLAKKFRLNIKKLAPERRNVRNRYGICFSDGTIQIRLNDLRSGKILRYSSLIDTLCHELAHLRYMNHGLRFQNLYKRILEFARQEKIYCPAPLVKQKKLGW